MCNHEPSKENSAMAMEATGIGRIAGQLDQNNILSVESNYHMN
jgi:hypothetical protein